MNVLRVACGGDTAYVAHTAAMLHSVLAAPSEGRVEAYYLHEPALPAEMGRSLVEMVAHNGGKLTLIEISDTRLAGLPAMARAGVSAAMWYRTFLPELLPDIDRILYLDADVIVLDSLDPLWELNLDRYHVAAVTNVWESWNVGYAESIGLKDQYFNSGVLLMNLELMRRDNSAAHVIEYAITNGARLPWPDQDALNIILGKTRLPLHPRWNCMNSILYFDGAAEVFGDEAVAEARRHPGIRHFEGPSINKPWHLLCQWEGQETYRMHRRQTPWPRYIPDGITAVNLLKWLRRAARGTLVLHPPRPEHPSYFAS